MSRRFGRSRWVIALAVWVGTAGGVRAANWVNPAGGSWSVAANWSPASVPNGGTVEFNLGAAAPGYTVTLPASVGGFGWFVTVKNDAVAFAIPSTATLSPTFVWIATGTGETGTFALTGGGTINSGNLVQTASAGGSATLNIDGAGTALRGKDLHFSDGTSGSTTINVTNGGALTNTRIGFNPNTYSYSGTLWLGSGGSSAILNVDGINSLVAADELDIGGGISNGVVGSGTVAVRNGGQVVATNLQVGLSRGSGVLSVDGSGTKVTVKDSLYVASQGADLARPADGTMSVDHGASVVVGTKPVGIGYGGVGVLSLANGSTMTGGTWTVGGNAPAGTGTMEILSGSSVVSTGVNIGLATSTSRSTVVVSSDTGTLSTWTANGAVAINKGTITVKSGGRMSTLTSATTLTDGEIVIESGGEFSTAGLTVLPGGTLVMNGGTLSATSGGPSSFIMRGRLTGNGTIRGFAISSFNSAVIGRLDGVLDLDGTVALTIPSFLSFDITSATVYDRVGSVQVLSFGGTLEVKFGPGYVPAAGDAFDLIDFASRTGTSTFATLSLPGLPTGMVWDTSALYTSGAIAVAVPEPVVAGWGVMGLLGWRRRRRV